LEKPISALPLPKDKPYPTAQKMIDPMLKVRIVLAAI
jgi:hypothetical protein